MPDIISPNSRKQSPLEIQAEWAGASAREMREAECMLLHCNTLLLGTQLGKAGAEIS